MAAAFSRNLAGACGIAAAIAIALAASASAQDAAPAPAPNSTSGLRLPQNPQVFGQSMPSVIKATAIVNGDVITQTDIDQRLALLVMSKGSEIPP